VAIVVVTAAVAGGCRPALDDRPWLVTRAQVVGWTAEPPEVPPGGDVAVQVIALGGGAGSPPDTSATAWSLCRTPKPVGENRALSADCLTAAAGGAVDAAGDPAVLTVPADACALFGPDTPQPAPGAPPRRPRDPDDTGGYFQPVVIALGPSVAVGLQRVTCDLPDASLAVARAFQAAYRPNRNPTIASLAFTVDGAPVDPAAAISPGARVTVEVAWSPDSAEPFALYDRASAAVVERAETLTVSWYITAGELDRAAAAIDDAAVLSASAVWTAPRDGAAVEIAVVLRDSRGGSDGARATMLVGDP
jgi:hypothetical protein